MNISLRSATIIPLLFCYSFGFGQEHKIRNSDGSLYRTIGAPKADYSWNHKDSYTAPKSDNNSHTTSLPEHKDNTYRPPAETDYNKIISQQIRDHHVQVAGVCSHYNPDARLWGFFDEQGTMILKPQYEEASDFEDGLAQVAKYKGYCGFIDVTGKFIIDAKYQDTKSFKDGLAPVMLVDKWGIIDRSGKEVVPFDFDDLISVQNGLYYAKKGKKYGFIDRTGKEIIPIEYDGIGFNEDEWIPVKKRKEWGFIDMKGNEVVPYQKFEYAHSFFNSRAAMRNKEKKWGFIDRKGVLQIGCQYSDIRDFSEGLAAVQNEAGKWGFIDTAGKLVLPMIYEDMGWSTERYGVFIDGLAIVNKGGESMFINKAGDAVVRLNKTRNKVRKVTPFKNGVAIATDSEGVEYTVSKPH